MKPNIYTQIKKIFSDWIDKKKYLIQYRVLKVYVRQRMIVDKSHEINFSSKTRG